MTEPTLADVIARLEAIEKRLEKLEALGAEIKSVRDRLAHHLPPFPQENETFRFISFKPSINKFTIELDREEDGRIIAEVPEIPGVLVYGQTEEQAIEKVQELALEVLADRVEHGEIQQAMVTTFRLPPTQNQRTLA
jgi:predicted RNase H-like HicB family nuclease